MTPTLARGLSPVRDALDNGAVVTVQATPMTPAVTISAAFRAGSVHDPAGLSGLAYLTSRLLDRGTERHSASDLAEELDNRGVSLKVSVNRHRLTLSCTCLSEDFDDILAIVVDAARRPTFPETEIEKKRAEAVTALRQREDNPASRAMNCVLELLYSASHPYGRPSKGRAADVERVTRDDMAAFHRRHVRPSVLSLVVVGDIRPEEVLERARLELDGWNGAWQGVAAVPPVGRPASRQQQFTDMPGKSQTDIVYGFTTIARHDPRYYAYWMMNNVLGQFGLGGRLADNVRERQGMAYYTFSTLDQLNGQAPLLIRAGVDPANVDRALAAIDHEVRQMGTGGPTATELEETRAYLIGSIPRMLETNESIASFLQTSEEFGLGPDFAARLPGILQGVTLDEVRTAAAEALDPDRAAVGIAGPQGENR